MNWTDLVMDAAPVKAVYGHDIPSLDRVDLQEISLQRDGPQVLLRFDLQGYPANAPKKWSAAGFNRVQIRLVALGVRDLQMAGWQSTVQVDLLMEREGPLIRLRADNGLVRFDLLVEHVIVDRISAYRDGPSDGPRP